MTLTGLDPSLKTYARHDAWVFLRAVIAKMHDLVDSLPSFFAIFEKSGSKLSHFHCDGKTRRL